MIPLRLCFPFLFLLFLFFEAYVVTIQFKKTINSVVISAIMKYKFREEPHHLLNPYVWFSLSFIFFI